MITPKERHGIEHATILNGHSQPKDGTVVLNIRSGSESINAVISLHQKGIPIHEISMEEMRPENGEGVVMPIPQTGARLAATATKVGRNLDPLHVATSRLAKEGKVALVQC
jgi:hypothetical protein